MQHINYFHLFLFLSLLNFSILFRLKYSALRIQHESSKKYDNLVNWIVENGGFVSNKLFTNEDSKSNRYMVAKDDIQQKEEIMFIPEIVLLSQINKRMFKACFDVFHSAEDSEFDCLVYFMTIDMYNQSSFFKPYYDYLPEIELNDFPSLSTLSKITNTEKGKKFLKELEIDMHLHRREVFIKESLEKSYESLKLFSEKNKIDFNEVVDSYLNSFFLVTTRNFGRRGSDILRDVNTMVPYLDLINHSDKYNIWWYYDEIRQGFSAYAVRNIKEGEEIFVSYGPHGNTYLYSVYGFAIKNNTNSHIRIEIFGFYKNFSLKNKEKDIESYYYTTEKNKKIPHSEAKNGIIQALNERIEEFEKFDDQNSSSLRIIFDEQIYIMKEIRQEFINRP